MRILFDSNGKSDDLARMLGELDAASDVDGIMILACDANGYTPETVDPVLQAVAKPLFGGVFPEVIYGNEHFAKGVLVVGLPCPVRVDLVEDISNPGDEPAGWTERLTCLSAASTTLFVFVDGFSTGVGTLIERLFNHYGMGINYLGGGCGSLSHPPGPCVISNQGLTRDSAVLARVKMQSAIGVEHGWYSISDALKVTEAEGCAIHTLDWQPAWPLYREMVEAHSKRHFADEDFFSIAKSYPFGMVRLDSEMVVRDPIAVQGNALLCVGDISSGTYVHILHGDADSLFAAAARANSLARESLGNRSAQATLVFDCISRALFLEASFDRELALLGRGTDYPLIGALTIGEIANNGKNYIEFYNKTVVAAII